MGLKQLKSMHVKIAAGILTSWMGSALRRRLPEVPILERFYNCFPSLFCPVSFQEACCILSVKSVSP